MSQLAFNENDEEQILYDVALPMEVYRKNFYQIINAPIAQMQGKPGNNGSSSSQIIPPSPPSKSKILSLRERMEMESSFLSSRSSRKSANAANSLSNQHKNIDEREHEKLVEAAIVCLSQWVNCRNPDTSSF